MYLDNMNDYLFNLPVWAQVIVIVICAGVFAHSIAKRLELQ